MSVTSAKRWVFATLLVVTGLGGWWGLQHVYGGKPVPLPRVISYLHSKKSTLVTDVRIMDVNGGNSLTLTGDLGTLSYSPGAPRWSPDGKRLLFTAAVNGTVLLSVAADGTDLRTILTSAQVKAFILANNPHGAIPNDRFGSADWSPDGQWAVFDFALGYPDVPGLSWGRLFAVRIADGYLVQITDDVAEESHESPRWSRSLNVISYVNILDWGPAELWVTDPVGTWRRQIIASDSGTVVGLDGANWSHGGNPQTGESSLVFTNPTGVGPSRLMILDVDLLATDPIAGVEVIANPTFELSNASWSPDDTRLVMKRGAPGVGQIAAYDLVSGATRILLQVDTSREGIGHPDWRAAP
jgi:Tol biopolymer transport system component